MVEEAGAGDAKAKQTAWVGIEGPGGGVDDAGVGGWVWRLDNYWMFGARAAKGEVWVGGGKAGEVMRAEDVGSGLIEERQIEAVRAGPDIGGEHGRADGFKRAVAGQDAVLVGLAEGVVARVEVRGRGTEGEDADRGRQGAVQGMMQVGRRDGCEKVEVGYLTERVDAGVGAS